MVAVPNSLGPGELLIKYGTEEQKNYYLPRLAEGKEIPCFALTAPTAGSDATAIPDTGVVCKGQWEGKEIIFFQIIDRKSLFLCYDIFAMQGEKPRVNRFTPIGKIGPEIFKFHEELIFSDILFWIQV